MRAVDETPPKVSLNKAQRIRLIVVGIFVAFVLARVVPDALRLGVPLGIFDYVTDGNGVVVRAPARVPKGTDELKLGDRVRVDRIKPFDRKPGLARFAYTGDSDNFERHLPIERAGKELTVHLRAVPEPVTSRVVTLVRILIFIVSVMLGAILVIVKPNLATATFFVFCISGEYPTTIADVLLPVPWREIPEWLGDMIRGAGRASLLLFALCLASENPRWQRRCAWTVGSLALLMGVSHAYALWALTYGGHPAPAIDRLYSNASSAVSLVTIAVFVGSFARAHGAERQRTGWIAVAFAIAGAARLLSDRLFPAHIAFWTNGILLSATVLPIVVVWVAVVKQGFFNVDFVVSRAIVYVSISAAFLAIIGLSEEIISYLAYNNTDLATGIVVAFSYAVGATFGKTKEMLDRLVDRFIFPGRQKQRKELERIAARVVDAETVEEVHQALLVEAADALKLSFSGIMSRTIDGGFELTRGHNWPDDCELRLESNDALTRVLTKSRRALTFAANQTNLIQKAFPNSRLTFVAPLYVERSVAAVVVYGQNVSGLDLDPEERHLLVRIVGHAALALNAIELSKYRAATDFLLTV